MVLRGLEDIVGCLAFVCGQSSLLFWSSVLLLAVSTSWHLLKALSGRCYYILEWPIGCWKMLVSATFLSSFGMPSECRRLDEMIQYNLCLFVCFRSLLRRL